MSGALLNAVVEANREFQQRQLWKRFGDQDCFAIRIAGEQEHLLASVLGATGKERGLLLFPGPDAAANLLAMTSTAADDEAIDAAGLFSVRLEAFGDLDTTEQAFLRKAGIYPRHEEPVAALAVKRPHRQARRPGLPATLARIIHEPGDMADVVRRAHSRCGEG